MSNKKTSKNTELADVIKNDPSVKELVIREGDAAVLREKVKVMIHGTITAPGNFASIRSGEHERLQGHVVFSKRSGFIYLQLDEEDHYGKKIEGKLVVNPEFKNFGVNTGKEYSPRDLQKFIRMNAMFFSDRNEAKNLVDTLAKVTAQVKKEIDDHNDDRGNKRDLLDVKVESNVPLDFTLDLPWFIGERNVKVKVEIRLEVRDRAIEMWLESPELIESVKALEEEIFERELARLTEYVQIEQ